MNRYPADAERRMKAFLRTLSEKDRRRYAAVEAAKLGQGGTEYVSTLFGIDPKTIRQGLDDLDQPDDPAAGRVRKKGEEAARSSTPTPGATGCSSTSSGSPPPAAPRPGSGGLT